MGEDQALTAGNKVAKLGEHFRLTQERWAQELGITRGTVTAYKNRRNASPSTDKIRELADRFGIPIQWFYDGEDTFPNIPRDLRSAELAAGETTIRAIHPNEMTPDERRMLDLGDALLPVWRGVVAGYKDECAFLDDKIVPPQAVPSYFLSGKNPRGFVVCLPAGVSMSPRIVQGDRVIVRLDPKPEPNTIIVARREDGVNFIKVFRVVNQVPELHSINQDFPVIELDETWSCRGVVVGIWKPYVNDGPNIEFNGGIPLRS